MLISMDCISRDQRLDAICFPIVGCDSDVVLNFSSQLLPFLHCRISIDLFYLVFFQVVKNDAVSVAIGTSVSANQN